MAACKQSLNAPDWKKHGSLHGRYADQLHQINLPHLWFAKKPLTFLKGTRWNWIPRSVSLDLLQKGFRDLWWLVEASRYNMETLATLHDIQNLNEHLAALSHFLA